MKRPSDLGRWELEDIVLQLQNHMYMDDNDSELDPDKEVSGAELVEHLGNLFEKYGLTPEGNIHGGEEEEEEE